MLSEAEASKVFNVYLDDQDNNANGNSSLYSIKYNFEPDSMNKSHGFMDISKDNNVSVSFPNLNSNGEEHHLFKGIQTLCKDTDYVLTFDNTRQGYILGKIDNSANLRYIRQGKKHALITNLEDKSSAPAKLGVMTMPKKRQQQKINNSVNVEVSNPEDEDLSELENIVLNDLNNNNNNSSNNNNK